jgi:hypothetical protein
MNFIAEFREYFMTLTSYKLGRGCYWNFYEFHIADLFVYVPECHIRGNPECHIQGNNAGAILDTLIRLMTVEYHERPIYIVISGKTKVDLLCVPYCVINIHRLGKLKNTVMCKIVSSSCIRHKSFDYLEYDIVFVERFNENNIDAAKIIDNGDINRLTDTFNERMHTGLHYIYINYVDDDCVDDYYVKEKIDQYDLLCVVYYNTVVINESHPSYDDLIEYMLANNYINEGTRRENFYEGCISYTVNNYFEFFANVDVHLNQKLIKNAYK